MKKTSDKREKVFTKTFKTVLDLIQVLDQNIPLFCFEDYFMMVKKFFGTHIINASFLFANSNITVKYYTAKIFQVSILLLTN